MKTGKNTISQFLSVAVFGLIFLNLCSCGSSNQVVSKRLIQKRKYTKGWFVKPKKNLTNIERQEIPFQTSEKVINDRKSNATVKNRKKYLPTSNDIASTSYTQKLASEVLKKATIVNRSLLSSVSNRVPEPVRKISSFHYESNNLNERSSEIEHDELSNKEIGIIVLGCVSFVLIIITFITSSLLWPTILVCLLAIVGMIDRGDWLIGILVFGSAILLFFIFLNNAGGFGFLIGIITISFIPGAIILCYAIYAVFSMITEFF